MASKIGEESGFFTAKGETGNTDSISVRISTVAQEFFERQQAVACRSPECDEEADYSGCCFPRGRVMSRKMFSDSPNMKGGAPYTRLGSEEDPESAKPKVKSYSRSRSVSAIYCCCGLAGRQVDYATVEVRAINSKSNGSTKQQESAKKWEVDINEETYSKPPLWKKLVRKVKAHGHVKHSHAWLNYNAHDYQMNFDDGCWREDCVSTLYIDEADDSVSRERAMHSALFQKFAATRTQHGPDSPQSPVFSPLPVRMTSKEELEKAKEGSVPIWQRRSGAPPIKLDLRQRAGQQE